MSNLDLKRTCLLDASGELTPEAGKELLDQISHDPTASRQYEATHEAFTLLSLLPIPEPSAEERRLIPAAIKSAIHAAMARPVNEARRLRVLTRYAVAALLLTVGGAVLWAMWSGNAAENRRHADQFARITASTDRAVPVGPNVMPYDQAVTDVEASIRQLQTESPTLSHVYDKSMANLLDALANVPLAEESSEDWPTGEPN